MNARECRRCGCDAAGHPPFIRGIERPGACGSCGCRQYVPERFAAPLLRRLLRRPPPQRAAVPRPGLPQRPAPWPLPGGETVLDRLPPRARPYVPGQREGEDRP